jgi:hypothetical protein
VPSRAKLPPLSGYALLGAGPDHKITVSPHDIPILAEIAAPNALMISIQWWLVRRRWRKRQARLRDEPSV